MYDIPSLYDLTGKVAVVTGGGDGIGRGACEILASAGASVVVSDINIVGPGATHTAALATVLTPEIEKHMLDRTPIHRLGKMSDIAAAILFFASPASEWISGQVLMVNGGGVQTLD